MKKLAFVLIPGYVFLVLLYFSLNPGHAAHAQAAATQTPTPFLPAFAEVQPSVVEEEYEVGSLVEAGTNELKTSQDQWPSEIEAIYSYLIVSAETHDLDKYGFDQSILAAMVMRESWFDASDPNHYMWTRCPDGPATVSCRGSSGEYGPLQVMDFNFLPHEDKTDLQTVLNAGARKLREMLDLTGGNIHSSLAAYNCGQNRDYEHIQKCQDYADMVFFYFEEHLGYPPADS